MADKVTERHITGNTVGLIIMLEGGELQAVLYLSFAYMIKLLIWKKARVKDIYDMTFVKKLQLEPTYIVD